MLDRTRTPDINDLGNLCRRYLDIAEIFDEYACNCDMPKDDDHRQTAERLCSAVCEMTDMLRELSAVASVLDGWAMPEDYGFPPEPIQAPHITGISGLCIAHSAQQMCGDGKKPTISPMQSARRDRRKDSEV